ncbi:MAG: CPBP family glutamic-type intramembrane protease [Clostridia bacterium]|nr:CPBP family glutamic-type intramembrane protease [Clostridia bacterium]
MKKYLKALVFVLVYIILPISINIGMLQLIKNVGWINSMRETTPTSAFLILDPVSITALLLLVKFVRKENPITFAKFKAISMTNGLICAGLGLALAMFTSSILKVDAFKSSVEPIGGSIDWIIGGNIILVILVTLINNFYKELCFRGLAFNEMSRVIPAGVALVVQATFYASELVYFQNPVSAVIYAFSGQLVFGIIYYFGGSIWSSFITQVCCTMGLILFKRTGLSGLFTSGSSLVLFIISILLTLIMLVVLYRVSKNQNSSKMTGLPSA